MTFYFLLLLLLLLLLPVPVVLRATYGFTCGLVSRTERLMDEDCACVVGREV